MFCFIISYPGRFDFGSLIGKQATRGWGEVFRQRHHNLLPAQPDRPRR